MREIYFSNEYYKNKAKEIISRNRVNIDSIISNEDALILLLKDVKYEDINNLCDLISIKLNINSLTSYELIQHPKNNKEKLLILYCIYELVKSHKYFGRNIQNNINTSSWLSHSVYEAIVSSQLASMLNLNEKYAFNYGLLHDYGRKYIHDFRHIIKGFESLIDLGIEEESKACLTHSFINGKRFFNNEVAPKDYKYKNDEVFENKDDIREILSDSKYTEYDKILNIADLMATSNGITTPYNRVLDIATRRIKIETSPNRKYFLAAFYNLLLDVLNLLNKGNDFKYIDPNILDIEEIRTQFKKISDVFYSIYKDNNKDDILKKLLKIG